MDLDFSQLSDDQLIQLIRLALQEAVSRHPAVEAAARAALLDEHEKVRIRNESAEREAAKLRAQERERIAKEAAEQVRRQQEPVDAERKKAEGEAERRRVEEAGKAAAREIAQREQEEKEWLRKAALLVNLKPSEITLCEVPSRDKKDRVVVNKGSSKYERSHLVDWTKDGTISTSRSLVSNKPQLVELCASFTAWAWVAHKETNPANPKSRSFKVLVGEDYDFGEEASNGQAS